MAFLAASAVRRRSLLLLRLFCSSPSSSSHAFDPALRRLARSGRFSEIESLLEPPPNSPQTEPQLASIVTSYAAAGMIDHALRTVGRIPQPSALSLNALLSACNHHPKLFRRVPDLFADLSSKYSIAPDKISYGILVKSHCRSRNAKTAFPILKEMEQKKIEITTVTYTSILDSLYKEKKPEEAEKLWNEMKSKGCVLDLPVYNVRIMYRASKGKPEDILDLIGEMESNGLKPDTITFNYLIVCYCNNGRFEDAKKVYQDLEKKGCPLNYATFKNYILALCKNGDFEWGLEVLNDSVKLKKVPDLGAVRVLVEGLVKCSKTRAAKRVVTGLKKKFSEDFVGGWLELEKIVGLKSEGEAEVA